MLIHSSYRPPSWALNRHIETIVPALLRKVSGVSFHRERIDTPDDDFLDLDWIKNDSDKLVIISHGLEGTSDRPYMKGMARAFRDQGFDVLCWNYRGCSGEMNRQIRFYHSGATDDLGLVIDNAISKGYKSINLVGFSLGGNLTLKYLGEQSNSLNSAVNSAVVFSVPMDLHGSCIEISKPHNILYARRFLRNLKKKVKNKIAMMPSAFDISGIDQIDNILDFDDRFTAPVHGFSGAIDYYTKCSSVHFAEYIKVPTLIVNAVNDSFLSNSCYPKDLLEDHRYVNLETPEKGGHCGFPNTIKNGQYWSELRAVEFVQSCIPQLSST